MILDRHAPHRRAVLLALLLLAVAPAAPARAEAEEPALEPTRRDELFASPRDDSELLRDELPWHAEAGTMSELLADLPGLYPRLRSSADLVPVLRGLAGHQSLVLVDGIPLNNAGTGVGVADLLGMIDPFQVHRVALLGGPRSVLFGSSAMGGVVSLTRRRPRFDARRAWDLAGEALARYDTAARGFVGHGAVEGHLRQFGLRVGGSFSRFGELLAGGDAGRQPFTGVLGGAADVTARWHLGDAGDLWLSYDLMRQDEVPRPLQSTPRDFSLTDERMRDLIALRYAGRFEAFITSADATLYYHLHRQRWQRFVIAGDRVEHERDQLGAFGATVQLVSELPYNRLTYGLDFGHERIDASVEQEEISSRTVTQFGRGRLVDGSAYTRFGAYALDRLTVGKLAFDLGGRAAGWNAQVPGAEGVDTTDWSVVGSLHGRYLLGDGVNLVAGVSQGYRAPTLDDYSARGCGFDRYYVPNDELRPERNVTLEAGVKLDLLGRLQGSVIYSFSHIADLVAVRPATIDTGSGPMTALSCGTNIDGTPRILPIVKRENARGAVHTVEGTLRLLLDRRFTLFASLAWARGQTTFDGAGDFSEPMDGVPPLNGLSGVRFTSRDLRWLAQVAVRWAIRQDRLSSADEVDPAICAAGASSCRGTAGYAALDLRGAVRLHEHARLTLSLQNLTDEPYRFHGAAIDAPGLSAILGLEVSAR